MREIKRRTGRKIGLLAAAIAAMAFFGTFDAYGATTNAFHYEDYAKVLETYVDNNGMVDYDALKANRARLDAFAAAIGDLSPKTFDSWSEKEKVAFWINAYNALTLKAIIDHYPIKSSFVASLRFPKNSIRQIPGVWDDLKFRVMGREMTLDEIEHTRLRGNFNEPRIHVALVCAALGCPLLRNEPFTADRLDAQLDDQASRFLKDSEKFRIDRDNGRIYLSPIFKWFGDDFIATYGTSAKFPGRSQAERAVLSFITRYLSKSDARYLSEAKFGIEYLDYDWSLNEQK